MRLTSRLHRITARGTCRSHRAAARRPRRLEVFEPRALLSGQAPLIINAAPYSEAYINGVYHDALGRSADPGALGWFTQQLDQGQSPGSVPAAILKSPEYVSGLVQSAYQQYLGRNAEPAALGFWLSAFDLGMRDEQLAAALAGSDEFYQNAAGNDAAWVAAVYQKMLDRAAQAGDIQWATGLLSAGIPRGVVALEVTSSVEHERQVVDAEYERYLHAPPDAGGWQFWSAQFATDQATPEFLAGALMSGNAYYEQTTGVAKSVVPVPSELPGWSARNSRVIADAAVDKGPVVFVGDSITQAWQLPTGEPVWNQYYAPLNALDAGVAGDATQNVLWRIESGELDGLAPKVVVLMVGVNNIIAGDTPQEVLVGVEAVIAALRQHLPDSKILLLSILPVVTASANEGLNVPIAATNQLLVNLADGQNVVYLNLWPAFTSSDGTPLSDLHVADGVHLDTAGYTVFAENIAPELDHLLQG